LEAELNDAGRRRNRDVETKEVIVEYWNDVWEQGGIMGAGRE
jgi:hypothetical protein